MPLPNWHRGVSAVIAFVGLASAAPAVTMDWTPIGDPGNACDPQAGGCFGAVAYGYSIGTYEVTNAQYAEFLNAVASSADPHSLYSTQMSNAIRGGITRSGSPGSFTYSTVAGRESWPVNHVGFYDAARFANWINNGQGSGDTESGAYTLIGPGNGQVPSNAGTVARNPAATIVLPSEDEWYKAAYYDPTNASYFDYPAASNATTTCGAPTGAANHAHCGLGATSPVPVGSYTGSASPYGTFDQGGNVWEWNEAQSLPGDEIYRGSRGGGFSWDAGTLAASYEGTFQDVFICGDICGDIGFRIAMVPEPGTGLLLMTGMIVLAHARRHT